MRFINCFAPGNYSSQPQRNEDSETGDQPPEFNESTRKQFRCTVAAIALVVFLLIATIITCLFVLNAMIDFKSSLIPVPKPTEIPAISETLQHLSLTTPKMPMVLEHPASQTVSRGTNLDLKCEFDGQVGCRWLRRGKLVDISGRYKYISKGNYDCSINIQSFGSIDVGDWTCVGLFDGQTVSSDKAWLTETVTTTSTTTTTTTSVTDVAVKLLHGPIDIGIKSGGEAVLTCEFTGLVDCAWLRRGEHIDISGRYSYVDNKQQEILRTDCSIKIVMAKAIDAGRWVCSSMADSTSDSIMSTPIEIAIT